MKTAPPNVTETPRAAAPAQARTTPGAPGPSSATDPFALLLGDLTAPPTNGPLQTEPVPATDEPGLDGTAAASADLPEHEADTDTSDPTLPFLALLGLPGEIQVRPTPSGGVHTAVDGNPGGTGASSAAQAYRGKPTDPRATARRQIQSAETTAELPLPAASNTEARALWSPASSIGQSATAQLTPPGTAQGDSPIQASLVSTVLGELRPGSEGSDTRQGGQPGGAWVDAAGSLRTTTEGTSTEAPPDFAMSLGEALGDAYEALGAEVSLWSAAQTKKASLRLDLGRAEALEVDVSIDDGKAQLAFRTDDATVREALRSQASTVLAEQFTRAGLVLESLSVGAQGQGASAQQGGGSGAERHRPWVLASAATQEGDALAETSQGLTGRTGSRGLDVYA